MIEVSIVKLFLLSLLLTCFATTATGKQWRGIVPGVTTRTDVVRLSGKCADPHVPCMFEENGDRIRVIFSANVVSDFYECAKKLHPDTVLLIEVTPANSIPLKKMQPGGKLKPLGPAVLGFRRYFDERTGLVLLTLKGKVIELNYVAATTDKHRCQDYYENPSDFAQVVTHCPPVVLEGPSVAVEGAKVTFRANVAQDPKMMLLWVLSAGKIVGDPRTRTISVDTAGLAGQTLKVTVQARGSCSVETSSDVRVTKP